MSGRDNCYDNAPALRLHGVPLMYRATLNQPLFVYIEIDYNRTRRHSAFAYISPDAFEAQIAA